MSQLIPPFGNPVNRVIRASLHAIKFPTRDGPQQASPQGSHRMSRSYRAFPAAIAVLGLALSSCGGGGSSGGMGAPSGLSYAAPPAFTVNVPITALSPTVMGSVTSYSVSPGNSETRVPLRKNERAARGAPVDAYIERKLVGEPIRGALDRV